MHEYGGMASPLQYLAEIHINLAQEAEGYPPAPSGPKSQKWEMLHILGGGRYVSQPCGKFVPPNRLFGLVAVSSFIISKLQKNHRKHGSDSRRLRHKQVVYHERFMRYEHNLDGAGRAVGAWNCHP